MNRKPREDFERFILILVLVLIFLMAARTPLDSDLWWHLRAGEQTWQSGQPVLADFFSNTRMGQPWINHSWLSEALMYLLYARLGFLGLGAGMALLATLSMALVYFQLDGPGLLKAFLLVMASLVAAPVWTPRPQTASLALMALTGYLLYRFKWRGVDRLWFLPPIFVLWSNLHGGYPLGLMLLGLMMAGEVANHLLGWQGEETLAWRKIGRLAGITLICGLAVLINPNGLDTWRIPFQTVGVQSLQQFVSEWASPDFHELAQQPLLWLLLVVLGAVGFSGRRLDATDFLSVAWFTALALVARRNYGPFALVAAPVAARHIWPALTGWWQRVQHTRTAERLMQLKKDTPQNKGGCLMHGVNLGMVALALLAAIIKLFIVTQPALVNAYDRQGAPADAVTWLAQNQPAGPLLNEYDWGGYLSWNLREYPVFIDGRTDLFGDEIIGEWMTVVQAGEGWQDVLARHGIRLILLRPERPVVNQLAGAGWKLLYSDKQAVIYGR